MSNNSEMFHPSEPELAVVALQQRASQNDSGFRICGMGRSLDEVKATNDNLILIKQLEQEKNDASVFYCMRSRTMR